MPKDLHSGDNQPSDGDRLHRYRQKRQRGSTPEPFGDSTASRPGAFVVQCHDARRLHYDLRLEIGGALRSWAVPKGFSADPSEKRLAVETEDHPIEYADFEGVIPPGNYGAGAMIVWDRGRWHPHIPPEQGLRDGKLLFDLYGYKLRGLWTLVRTTRNPKEWLLIKKPDGWARTGDEDIYPEHSVLSGLEVDQLASSASLREELRLRLSELELPPITDTPFASQPMLAELTDRPFDRKGWIYEVKYDGYRILAAKEGEQSDGAKPDPFGRRGGVRLLTRNNDEVAAVFPEVARTLLAMPYPRMVLDGEVVVLDDDGRASFSRLQKRAQTRNRFEIDRATVEHPATLMAFDLLALEDYDLRDLPLLQRKELLRSVLPSHGAVRYTDHVLDRGKDFYRAAHGLGLEGMVGKDGASRYRPGRSDRWRKVRSDKTDDFVVVGWSHGKGARASLGSLHLATWENGELIYVGAVGSGFRDAELKSWTRALEPLQVDHPPCTGEVPTGPGHFWVAPELVAEVRFSERSPAGMLRHPVFLRQRTDKKAQECAWQGPSVMLKKADDLPRPHPDEVEITRPQKVFWAEDDISKGDLVDYYRRVAPSLLPWLKDRPLVLDRYPDGIHGKSFYQKNAPEFAPDWIRVEPVGGDEEEKTTDYFVCDDLASLLYIANLGAIPLHIWSSRLADLAHPDWCILDLDPKGAPFAHVVKIAGAIRRLTQTIGLPSYPKTSGGSGMHVLIPLGGQLTHEQSRQLAGLIAQFTVNEHPDIATTARALARREGKVYVDYLQNGHGRLLVAPYSVRPHLGAPVSAPLRWSEVRGSLDPSAFHLRNMPARIARQRSDPLAPLLGQAPDLQKALTALLEKVS